MDRCASFEARDQIGRSGRKRITSEAAPRQLDLGAPDRQLLDQIPRTGRDLRCRSAPAPEAIELESEAAESVTFADQVLGHVGAEQRAELVDERALTPIPIPEII